MPEFKPGEKTTARGTLINPTAKQWTYEVELYLGVTKEATSGVGSVTIAAGASQVVDLPVTMPSVEGTYPVYLDVLVAGVLLEHHRAAVNGVPDDVVIVSVLVPPPGEGLIWGFVHDGVTKEPLPDVKITLDGLVRYTSSQGAYEIRNIALQQYRMQFSKEGYVAKSYVVNVTTDTRVNTSLSPPLPATEPQLLYVGPAEIVEPQGGSANIDYEITIPDIPILEELALRFYLEGYRTETIGGGVQFAEGTTAGTYSGGVSISLKRFVWRVGYVDYPTGVYRLLSSCFLRHDNAVLKTYWQDVDTGVIITVI